jgi:NADH dehydrogenase/putative oxidoreductase
MRFTETTVAPLLDVFIRLWLAGIFWASGMVKLQSWTTALYLSAHEYPVSWLDPVTAAWLGEAVEIVCPPLLVFGLATRFAALPMLILSLVIQFSYQAHSVDHRRDCDPNALDYPIIHRRFAFANRGWYCAGG